MKLHKIKQSGSAQQESLNTTDKQNLNSKPLVEIIEVEKTPFAIAREEEDYTVILGNHKISKAFETEEEAKEYVKADSWELRMSVTYAVIQTINKQEELINKLKEQ